MDRPLSVEDLDSLDETEQGVVLAALLTGQDEGPLDRIAEGPRCRQALEGFRRLEPARRRQAVANLARSLLSPLPSRLERVHPSWIQALLEREPAPVVQLVVRSLPPALQQVLVLPALPSTPPRVSGAIQAQILRSVLSQLAVMPPAPAPAPSVARPESFDDLVGWTAERLERTLEGLGALALASGLQVDPALRERTLVGLPAHTAALLRRALTLPLPHPRELPVHPGALQGRDRPLSRLGAQLLAAACPSTGEVRRQLAQRLPRELGQSLLETAQDPLDPRLLLRLCGEADALACSVTEANRR